MRHGVGVEVGCDLAPKAFCLDWMIQGSQARETEGSKKEADGGNASEKRKYAERPFLFPAAR